MLKPNHNQKPVRIEFFWPIIFIIIGVLGLILLPFAISDRDFSSLEEVEGVIQNIIVSERNENTIEVTISSDERLFWVIPRSARLITKQDQLSVELIKEYLTIGMNVKIDVVSFRGNLAVVGIKSDDSIILDLQQSIDQAQSESATLLWTSIIVALMMPIGVAWLVRSSIKFKALKAKNNNSKIKEN